MGRRLAEGFGRTATPGMRREANRASEALQLVAVREATVAAARERSSAAARRAAQIEAQLAERRRDAIRDLDAEARLETQRDTDRARAVRRTEQLARAELQLTRARNDANEAERRLHRGRREEVTRGRGLRDAASGVGGGLMSFAWAGAGPVLLAAAAAATAATGALGLLPGVAAAAGAGIGSLVIATRGFGDAITNMGDPDKFAEALQTLSPNAQQAALAIQRIMPALHELKQATQDSLFSGVGEELWNLNNTFNAPLKGLTTGIAGSFNETFKAIGDTLMQPEAAGTIQHIFDNVAKSFQQMAPAATSFTDALVRIISVGSDFFPGMAKGISDAAAKFAAFIENAQKSGQLRQWISDGIDAAKTLGGVVIDAGKAFGALAEAGREFLPPVVSALRNVSEFLRDHPKLIYTAVGAFALFKTVKGISELTTALQGISTLLRTTIPASAAAGAAATSAAWAPFLASLAKWGPLLGVGAMPDQKNASELGLILPGIPQLGGGPGAQRERRGVDPENYAPAVPPGSPFPGLFDVPAPPPEKGSGGEDRYAGLNIADFMPPNVPTGGSLGDMYALAQSASGRTAYGAASDLVHGLADCSGSISDLYEVLTKGVSSPERMFTTANFGSDADAAKLGFLPGYAPGALNIGVTPYGPNAHMAATLPNGVNFEGGGAIGGGAQYGGNAAGALDPQFQKHYYLAVGNGSLTDGGQDAQRAAYDLARARMEKAATDRDPKASSLDKADAAQRVLEAGQNYDKALQKLAEIQQGTFGKLKSTTDKFADGLQQFGAKIDDDFGISKGLGGIAENITKFLANLAFAPVLGALSGVTAANGTAGPGTGLLGSLAPRQNIFGQEMPNVLGQYSPSQSAGTTPGGYSQFPNAPVTPISGGIPGISTGPGNGTLTPAGSPSYVPLTGPQLTNPGLTTPAPTGAGSGSLPGIGPIPRSYNTGTPWQLPNATGSWNTPSMGVPLGEGMPQSQGIGFGKGGLTGLAGSAIVSGIAAAGMMSGGMDGGAGGAAASALAQIGIDLANRTISYGGQVAGILAQGAMETFLPVESQLADPTRGWLGRIVGGIAGIRPVAENLAGAMGQKGAGDKPGQDGPLSPEQVDKQKAKDGIGSGATNTTNVGGVTVNAELHGQPDANARALSDLTSKAYAPAGGGGR